MAQEALIWEKWADFKNLFVEDYHNLCKMQRINSNQAVFHGANMEITMQDNIAEAL